jgi:hypothetical protein
VDLYECLVCSPLVNVRPKNLISVYLSIGVVKKSLFVVRNSEDASTCIIRDPFYSIQEQGGRTARGEEEQAVRGQG